MVIERSALRLKVYTPQHLQYMKGMSINICFSQNIRGVLVVYTLQVY